MQGESQAGFCFHNWMLFVLVTSSIGIVRDHQVYISTFSSPTLASCHRPWSHHCWSVIESPSMYLNVYLKLIATAVTHVVVITLAMLCWLFPCLLTLCIIIITRTHTETHRHRHRHTHTHTHTHTRTRIVMPEITAGYIEQACMCTDACAMVIRS